MTTAEILPDYVRCVHPSEIIRLLEVVRSSEVFALADAQRAWDASAEALRTVVAGFCAAGVLNAIDEGVYELTDEGRVEVNKFFTGIAWARRGGRWDQPLSVAYSTAVALFDQAIKEFGRRLPFDEAQALLDLLDAASRQERELPGMIFEAMWIGGGNAQSSQPIRCGMVYWLKARVHEIRGELEGAIQAFRIAFENFAKHGRTDLLFSVRADVESLWRLIRRTRNLAQQAVLLRHLEQWGSDHLPEVGRQIWCDADFHQGLGLGSPDERMPIGMVVPHSQSASWETGSSRSRWEPRVRQTEVAYAAEGPPGVDVALFEHFRGEYLDVPLTNEEWGSRIDALAAGGR